MSYDTAVKKMWWFLCPDIVADLHGHIFYCKLNLSGHSMFIHLQLFLSPASSYTLPLQGKTASGIGNIHAAQDHWVLQPSQLLLNYS